jgi:hypothetical protein
LSRSAATIVSPRIRATVETVEREGGSSEAWLAEDVAERLF